MKGSKDEPLRLVARARLARVELAQNNADAALRTLGGGEPGAFTALYDVIRGDALYAKGDRAGAVAAWRKAEAVGLPAGNAPTVDAVSLQLKIADVLADGVKDVTVPAATTAASPAAAPVPVKP